MLITINGDYSTESIFAGEKVNSIIIIGNNVLIMIMSQEGQIPEQGLFKINEKFKTPQPSYLHGHLIHLITNGRNHLLLDSLVSF